MKNLRINNGRGEFSLNGVDYTALDEITKEDLLALLDISLDPEQEMEMDEYDTELIVHQAHKIIYHNLYDKFSEVIVNKRQFNDDVNELYEDAYDKYKVQEPAELDELLQ